MSKIAPSQKARCLYQGTTDKTGSGDPKGIHFNSVQ